VKRAAFLFFLSAVILVELILLESFLPYGYPQPIFDQLNRVFPGRTYLPHAHMDLEIETILRLHLSWRIAIYLLTAALVVGNAFLISKTWKAWRLSKPPSPQT
jgi:hypothetical protein